MMRVIGTALSLPMIVLSIARAGEPPTRTSEVPSITVKVPKILHGSATSPDLNPCFPGTADAPWLRAADPGTTSLKKATLGVVQKPEITKRAQEDIRALETSCFGATFRPVPKLKRPDGPRAITYRGASSRNDNTITVAYYLENGQLVRLSLWCSSAIGEAVLEEILKMYVSGEINDSNWKPE